MSKASPRPQTGRLGTQMRGTLSSAYNARGHNASDLIFAYSPKMDVDVILRSSLEYAHFLLVESDVSIVRVDYAPQKRFLETFGRFIGTVVDAEIINTDGEIIWREVKYDKSPTSEQAARDASQIKTQRELAKQAGVTHEVLTNKEIFQNPLKIKNWNRIIAWMAQARDFNLHYERQEIISHINKNRRMRFQDILSLGSLEQHGKLAAALFLAVQRAEVDSDLDEAPLSAASLFYQSRDPHDNKNNI